MPAYKRPGTYAEEVLVSQQPAGANGTDSVSAIIGTAQRGPTTPRLVTSWTQYVRNYGAFNATNSALPYAVFFYFANGGRGCYVNRVVSGTAIAATRTFSDRASTPLATLSVSAANPGTWGNAIQIDIVNSGLGRFDLVLHLGGADSTTVVERWNDLSMVTTDPRYAPNIVNSNTEGSLGSAYVVVADLNSTSTATDKAPAAQAGVSLATGTEGGALSNTDWTTAIDELNIVDQPLVLNLAGQNSKDNNVVLTYAVNWAAIRGDGFVVVDPAAGRTPTEVLADALTLPVSGYAAAYYPHLVVADPAAASPGVTKILPPGGSVLGLIERTDASRGVNKAPAGLDARMLGALALERKLISTDLDNLNSATPAVNAIRAVPGAGIVVMGAKTLTSTTADKYIPNRRTLIYLKSALKNLTQFAIFEPNNAALWASIDSVCTRFLTSFWQTGGLAGLKPSDAFFVNAGSDVNTYAVTQAGEVRVEIGVALTYPAEFVVIRIGQTVAGSSIVESA